MTFFQFQDINEAYKYLEDNILNPNYVNSSNKVSWDIHQLPRICFEHQILAISKNKSVAEKQIIQLVKEKKFKWFQVLNSYEFRNSKLIMRIDEWNRLSTWIKSILPEDSKYFDLWCCYCDGLSTETVLLAKDLLNALGSDCVEWLIKTGYLVMNSDNLFVIAFPFIGRFINQVRAGRQELVSFLMKQKHKESSIGVISSRKLNACILTPVFCLLDLLGSGEAYLINHQLVHLSHA